MLNMRTLCFAYLSKYDDNDRKRFYVDFKNSLAYSNKDHQRIIDDTILVSAPDWSKGLRI